MTVINVNGVSRNATPQELAAIEAAQAAVRLPTLEAYQEAIQTFVDATARSKQFANGVTLASYAASTVPAWAAQAAAFIAWRDVVWGYAYLELAKVQSGQRAQPSVAEIINELPVIDWPGEQG